MRKLRDRIAGVAALNEPLRHKLYEFVSRNRGGVTRDDAAKATGMARSVAAFHLDKLADAGLLDVEFRRPSGRGGPGAGRPAKYYSRSSEELSISLPERRYDLSAQILADAVEHAEAQGRPIAQTVSDAARRAGEGIAAQSTAPDGWSTEKLVEVLAENGYEPHRDGDSITLDNCPFRSLADEHQELMCTMNLNLLTGLTRVAGLPRRALKLEPARGRCCVTLQAREAEWSRPGPSGYR